MVTVNLDKQNLNGYILLETSLSESWKNNIKILILFSLFTLVTAFYSLFFGKWMVLPFSGLELIVFLLALFVFFRRCKQCQVIRFTFDKVIIEQGAESVEHLETYKRIWSKFYINKHRNHDDVQIFIRDQDKQTEIGPFLNQKDKQELIHTLKTITAAFND